MVEVSQSIDLAWNAFPLFSAIGVAQLQSAVLVVNGHAVHTRNPLVRAGRVRRIPPRRGFSIFFWDVHGERLSLFVKHYDRMRDADRATSFGS